VHGNEKRTIIRTSQLGKEGKPARIVTLLPFERVIALLLGGFTGGKEGKNLCIPEGR